MDSSYETDRLVLRRFSPDDADFIHALDNDPEVMRYLNGGTPTPRSVVEAELLPRILGASTQAGFGFWAAVEKATGNVLGWFSFHPRDGGPSTVELGCRLCRAAWGRGYATEGARVLVYRGFTEFGVERVVASTFEHNRASRRVLEKLGFRLARRYRLTAADLGGLAATYHVATPILFDGDDLDYVLDRADWEPFR